MKKEVLIVWQAWGPANALYTGNKGFIVEGVPSLAWVQLASSFIREELCNNNRPVVGDVTITNIIFLADAKEEVVPNPAPSSPQVG